MCGSPRKFASKKDVQFYRGAPNWGPHAVFHLNRLDKFLEDEARNEDALKHFGLPYVSLASLPRIAHASLFDFYKHISYDYKNRVYLDSLGKPIVYSYL